MGAFLQARSDRPKIRTSTIACFLTMAISGRISAHDAVLFPVPILRPRRQKASSSTVSLKAIAGESFLVRRDGSIEVFIQWERRRWYWTNRRNIVFRGEAVNSEELVSLEGIRLSMAEFDPSANPLCARF